jgi:hypothetical protein
VSPVQQLIFPLILQINAEFSALKMLPVVVADSCRHPNQQLVFPKIHAEPNVVSHCNKQNNLRQTSLFPFFFFILTAYVKS